MDIIMFKSNFEMIIHLKIEFCRGCIVFHRCSADTHVNKNTVKPVLFDMHWDENCVSE